jgi:hypothetical protein
MNKSSAGSQEAQELKTNERNGILEFNRRV